MKVLTVVGTRPNFIKEFAIHRAFRQAGIRRIMVHTGQHYDYEMSQIFFEELAIPRPDFITSIVKGSHAEETASIMVFVESVLREVTPDWVLVYGDVNSTLAAAVAAAKRRIPVAHVEAGLRCTARSNPEEINRRVADTLSDLLFPHIPEAESSLLDEGYSPDRVHMVGDVVCDSLRIITKKHRIRPRNGDYLMVTLHRAENADRPERLEAIVRALMDCGQKCVFPLHPRTRAALKRHGMLNALQRSSTVRMLPPSSYVQFLKLVAHCDRVVSDSGGARREAYLLGKATIAPIDFVWVPGMVRSGWEKPVAAETKALIDAIRTFRPKKRRPNIFGDGRAAERIARIIKKF